MQPLKIPQSQIISGNGMMASEWLVFINEFIRLCNAVITSGTISKAEDAEFNSVQQVATATHESNEISTYVAPIIARDEVIDSVPILVSRDEPIINTAIIMQHDEQPLDNPYALLSAIKQQQYEQQLWSLTV